jgi:lysophospholipase L1-like esterase
MRYLLFGASVAVGETDYENGGWAGHLKRQLDAVEKHPYFLNLAISGNTSRIILNRIENEAKLRIRDKPKEEWTIIISVGTNDSRIENNEPLVPEEEYRENLTKIIKIAKGLAGKVILIGGTPVIEKICNPWKQKCDFLNERIKRFGQIMSQCAEAENIEFIELFSKLENRPDLESLSDDGLHPNKEGHLAIFNIVKEFFPTPQ